MPASRPISWLPLAVFLGAVFAGLCALMFGYAGDRSGRQIITGAPPVAGQPPPDAKVEQFVDEHGTRTLAEIQALPADAWRVAADQRSFRLKAGAIGWLRVTLRNPTDHAQRGALVVSDFFQDLVEAWVPEDGAWRHERSGEKVRGSEKPWWGRDSAFPVEVPAGGERTVYLRTSDFFTTVVVLNWWPSAAALHRSQVRQLVAEGLYFGVLLALWTYNLILWFRLRAPDIGFYVLNVGAITVFMSAARALPAEFGLAFASPGVETVVVCSVAASGFFLTRFARVFLELDHRSPRSHRMTRGASWLMGGLALGGLSTPWTSYSLWMPLTAVATVFTHTLLLTIAVRRWRAGVRQARFFILSFGCLAAGALPLTVIWLFLSVVLLRDAGLQGLMIGSALEMMLLSLAIADRFVQAQRERAAAQQQLIEEAERRRAIQEAYADELEVEVRERTRELEAITADKDRMIMVLGHDLRAPLTGLTQSAEQLAADPLGSGARSFAREAATTGRQLLLLIEDLVLWARLRSSGRQAAACSVASLVAPAVAVHRHAARNSAIELSVDASETLTVETDLVPAQTLVRNLLDNAVRHARQRVEVSAAAEGAAVRLRVRDDGPGLSAEVAAWLADPNIASWPTGRGLGLRLCSEISRAMGLRLETHPVPGGGTEFSILFKAAVAPEIVL